MDDIRRVAIVNRGEAAMRALRAVAEYDRETGAGIRTIALYTDPDAASWFVRDAHEAYHLGPATALDAEGKRQHTYLDRERLLAALAAVRADAVWVGWGFVAEDAEFAEQCEKAGITFIGPPSEVIRRLGNKVTAKELAEKAGVPVGLWSGRPVETAEEAAALARDLGYPLLIKAASGGGGRGIRRVEREEDLAGALASARAEAELAFGDPTVFLERLVGDAHHVEVQVIADAYGTVWAVGVRDCSLQRRNQKILEESASVPPPLREQLKADAVRLCQASGYRSAGTVEFLYDAASQDYQFMEVNTRLQVEHPVTELTTGLDLVKLQVHVARGGRLEGEPPPETGHAVEVRLNAEDPERGFAPAPGRVEFLRMPAGPGIRVDTGIAQGDVIAGEFDAMVAKLLSWGRDRTEALARLRRALLETMAIVHGGTTNKAFLLTLLDRPEVIEGRVDTGWLDRLTRSGQHVPPHHGSCLVAAAIEAYEADHAAERTRFLQSAARGRPELSDELGHQVELRFRGQTYPLIVHRLGPGRYRLDTGDGVVDAALERLNTYERRLELNGDRLKVIADVQGPTYQIELEGVPHRIERDDGGFVRSPAPAVVISFAVSEGDEVATGEPVALIESMKMETTVHAPFPGRVRRLLSAANAQVDAGAPLVQLEPLGVARQGDASGRVRFDRAHPAAEDGGSVEQRCAALLRSLRSHLLGYDLDRMTDQRLTYELPAACAALRDDGTVLGLEREILGIYADLGQLSRRSPGLGDEEESATGASPREYLLTYLRSVDRAGEILPERFLNRLRRALQRYDVASLDRTPALEEALVWMYRAFLRLPRLTPAVAAILDRWLARGPDLSTVVGEGLRDLLDRVVDAAEGRAPTVGDLARQVRFRLVDQPLLERARQAQYAAMDATMAAIEQHPARADREELVEQLVACPQPLRPLLLRHGLRVDAPDMREVALEVRIKRFYRIRDLSDIRFVERERCLLGVADYVHEGRVFHLVAAYARWEACDGVLATIADHVAGVERDRRVIVDLTLQHADTRVPIDELEQQVRALVEAVPFDRDLHRVDTTVTFAGREPQHRRTSHLTFRQRDGRLAEDPLYRNLHPMLAKRVGVWRLRNFAIERLPSAEDVYLFLGTGKDNPGDRRLFALAEVRDLTPVMDRDGRIAALPHLERMVMESFSAMREYLSRQPVGRRPARNRLILDVRPPSTVPPEQWRDFAHRLAPASAGLDVEKVVVWGQVPDGMGGFEEAVLEVENVGQRGVVVRREPPSDEPVATLDAYRQKVLRTERRGGTYPYELVTRLTPREGTAADFPPGEFVEHDLDEEGRLQPVGRPHGQNTANLVVGLITNRTANVPEGLRRVIIIGDPSRSLGSLAEPECRRIMAALDLAEELRVPVEWFAVSSGARIAMDSGTENMDWIAGVLRRLVEFTQAGGEVNVVVTGINVGAQPYWNAEATMLMHTRGILIMTPASAMVLTGKEALDFSGGVSAEDNFGIGGFDRIMGPNGEGQYWAPTLGAACDLLYRHYEHTYVVPGERYPRRMGTTDPVGRDVCEAPHAPVPGNDFTRVGDVFSSQRNPERKKPFDMRSVMRAVTDLDGEPLERWKRWEDAETVIVWDAHVGGIPVCLLGIESHTVQRRTLAPAGGPSAWTAGTLFPQSSRKAARALNAASGNRPVVVLANLSGFDGSPESMREWQLEYGAEIGRAVTNFRGPIVFCVVSRYHGGAFVVFSKALNERMEIAAVEGSYASVIGGTPAAAVVFAREVRKRTQGDPRVAELRAQVEGAAEGQVGALRAELERVRQEVHAETIGRVAQEFDAIHSIERARRVGSVDRIIAPAALRPYICDALERGMARS